MKVRAKISGTSQALDRVIANEAEAGRMLRRLPWGEAGLTIIGTPSSWPGCLAARYALEWLAGWPVRAREASEFMACGLEAIQPRSVIVAVSSSGDEEEILEGSRMAISRGARLLAVTGAPESFLAQLTDNVFSIQAISEEEPKTRTGFLEHSVLLWLSVLAAKIFNPRHPQLCSQEQDFRTLPERINWMETHLLDVVRTLAQEIAKCNRVFLLGSGFCFAATLHAPPLAQEITPLAVQALAPAELLCGVPQELSPSDAFLFLSSSRSPARNHMVELAAQIGKTSARLFSFTDTNDRPLIDTCEMSILIPSIAEIPASLLELALLQWLLLETSEVSARKASSR